MASLFVATGMRANRASVDGTVHLTLRAVALRALQRSEEAVIGG
jgi:hypothetical protein